MTETELKKVFTARQMELLLKAFDFVCFDRNDLADELSFMLITLCDKSYEGPLTFDDIKKWIFEVERDRIKYPLDKKLIDRMFNITETNELIRYFDETPYARSAGSNELNQEMLARILNDYGYDGILDVDEIKAWVDKHSDKNAYIWKDIVHRKVKLDSSFDPTVNQEAA